MTLSKNIVVTYLNFLDVNVLCHTIDDGSSPGAICCLIFRSNLEKRLKLLYLLFEIYENFFKV